MAVLLDKTSKIDLSRGRYNNVEMIGNKFKLKKIDSFGNANINVAPIMTSNNTPSPYSVSASSEYNQPGYQFLAFKCFDRNISGNHFYATSGDGTGWIIVDLFAKKSVNKYALTCSDGSIFPGNTMINNWQFEGSNDTNTWVILDSKVNISWNIGERKEFICANYDQNAEYRYYRLNIGNHNHVPLIIAEIELFEPVFDVYADIGYFESEIIDTTQFIKQLLTISLDFSVTSDSSVRVYTKTSNDGWNFDKYQLLNGNSILSPTQRFIQIKVELLGGKKIMDEAGTIKTIHTPIIKAMWLNYKIIDPEYYSLIFSDMDDNVYSTSTTLIKMLDYETIIAGQTTDETQIKLNNFYNFPVSGIKLTSVNTNNGIDLEMSKGDNPFNPQSELLFSETLNPDDFVTFFVRVKSTTTAISGGTIGIKARQE